MAGDLDMRRRRAQFRASHRGTKEMDWLLGRFAEARLAEMDEAALGQFERLLALPDPDLESWIMNREPPAEGDHARLLKELRAFHRVEVLSP
jgi:antitoxin CptB